MSSNPGLLSLHDPGVASVGPPLAARLGQAPLGRAIVTTSPLAGDISIAPITLYKFYLLIQKAGLFVRGDWANSQQLATPAKASAKCRCHLGTFVQQAITFCTY